MSKSQVLSNSQVLDTRFRSALARMGEAGRVTTYGRRVDPRFEVAALMKRLDGGPALFFPDVDGYSVPVIGNFLCCKENCEAAFGLRYDEIRTRISQSFGAPQEPVLVERAPAQEVVKTSGFDLRQMFPVLEHASGDAGRFITAGVIIVRDPETQVYNASFHRLQLLGPNRTGIKLDYGRHLRLAVERARQRGKNLPIVVCIGTDIAVQYAAGTMGSQMPEHANELAVAGGLAGRPIEVVKARTQDLIYPAHSEIVLEGIIRTDIMEPEGPFGEFVGFAAPQDDAPVIEVTAVSHRQRPIYHAMNGYGRESVMLRKYVLEASLLKVLQTAVPIVTDVEMTAGGLHRFHAVIQVKKGSPQHDGLQRNAMLAAFGTLKDLDLAIVVDDDIDLQNPADVEYALATRFEASRDVVIVPGARGHEYVRASQNGIRAKLGLDATVPYEERDRFRRIVFAEVDPDREAMTTGAGPLRSFLEP
jgi:2,5-furandicarboxylate decarboxylase 1